MDHDLVLLLTRPAVWLILFLVCCQIDLGLCLGIIKFVGWRLANFVGKIGLLSSAMIASHGHIGHDNVCFVRTLGLSSFCIGSYVI